MSRENGDTLLGTTDERDVDALEDVEDVLDVGGFQHLRSRRCLPGERQHLRWTPLDRRSLFFTHRDITWDLVDVFENHLQPRNIAEKGKPQTIPTRRRMKWIRSANDLLDDHPVEDVVAVLDIVFTRWDGLLPFPVINDYTGRVDPRLRRVTRLAQIIEDFPGLLAMVNEPAHLAEIIDPADAPDAPAEAEGVLRPWRGLSDGGPGQRIGGVVHQDEDHPGSPGQRLRPVHLAKASGSCWTATRSLTPTSFWWSAPWLIVDWNWTSVATTRPTISSAAIDLVDVTDDPVTIPASG